MLFNSMARVGIRIRIRIRISVLLVNGYAHVFILLAVVFHIREIGFLSLLVPFD